MQMPRRNIEFKARDLDPERTLRTALAAGAQDAGWLAQTDTYFNVPHGRLKLREESDCAHLIAYQRPDDPAARESRYRLVSTDDPAGLRDALTVALGVLVVVKKERHLLLWQNVRIHLDTVDSLGQFIGLEAVADPLPTSRASTSSHQTYKPNSGSPRSRSSRSATATRCSARTADSPSARGSYPAV